MKSENKGILSKRNFVNDFLIEEKKIDFILVKKYLSKIFNKNN